MVKSLNPAPFRPRNPPGAGYPGDADFETVALAGKSGNR